MRLTLRSVAPQVPWGFRLRILRLCQVFLRKRTIIAVHKAPRKGELWLSTAIRSFRPEWELTHCPAWEMEPTLLFTPDYWLPYKGHLRRILPELVRSRVLPGP